VPVIGYLHKLQGADIDSEELKGIIPRITEQIFASIAESDPNLEYLVKVSYMEIYLERIRDLLARGLPLDSPCCFSWSSYSPK
jgi:kinesin family protein 5